MGSWAPMAPARPPRSERCSISSGRPRASSASLASSRRSTRSRSTAASATSPASSPCMTASRAPRRSSTSPTSAAASMPGYQAELIARLDLDPSRGTRSTPRATSRRSGIVVALQHRPDLLVLDEPTSGLDPLVQQSFFELVREAMAAGRTVFLSSHILSEVEKTCGRVVHHPRGPAGQDRYRRGAARPRPSPGGAALHGRRAHRSLRGAARGERCRGRGPRPPIAGDGRHHTRRPCGRPVRPARLRESRAEPRGDIPGAVRPPAAEVHGHDS